MNLGNDYVLTFQENRVFWSPWHWYYNASMNINISNPLCWFVLGGILLHVTRALMCQGLIAWQQNDGFM